MKNLSPLQDAFTNEFGRYNRKLPRLGKLLTQQLPDDDKLSWLEYNFEPGNKQGFGVTLIVYEDQYQVSCDGWHEDYSTDEETSTKQLARMAMDQLVTLLNGQTKLRIKHAGKHPYSWELLYEYRPGKWESLGTTTLIFYNWLGKRRVSEHQNRLITARVSSKAKSH